MEGALTEEDGAEQRDESQLHFGNDGGGTKRGQRDPRIDVWEASKGKLLEQAGIMEFHSESESGISIAGVMSEEARKAEGVVDQSVSSSEEDDDSADLGTAKLGEEASTALPLLNGNKAADGTLNARLEEVAQSTLSSSTEQETRSESGMEDAEPVDPVTVLLNPLYEQPWFGRRKISTEDGRCDRLLEEGDRLSVDRDFDKEPVRVWDPEERIWECGVGCVHTTRDDGPFDASIGGGSAKYRVLRSMEAAAYYSQNNPETARQSGVDIVMTVHFNSDVPVQYGSWEEYDIMRPVGPKDDSLGLAAAFISNCNAHNFRLDALQKLNDLIKLDSYGRCMNTKNGAVDKQETLSKYKFSLAFENSCERDYVTEKFWQSLVAGAVPIVIGAPNIADFAPNDHSFIHIKSVEELPDVAKKMFELSKDGEAWEWMVDWKVKGPSGAFLANMDISTVHSSCRLCVFVADKIRADEAKEEKRTRPCRCSTVGGAHLYHIYARERHTFNFFSVFLETPRLTLDNLKSAIQEHLNGSSYKPVWATKRPEFLRTPEIISAYKIFHIYPSGSTQREALHGVAWFRSSADFVKYVASHPCPQLDFILI